MVKFNLCHSISRPTTLAVPNEVQLVPNNILHVKGGAPDPIASDGQRRVPLSKQRQPAGHLSVVDLSSECRRIVPPKPINEPSLLSRSVIEKFLQHSMHMAVEDFVASGRHEELLDETIGRTTEFEAQSFGTYRHDDHCIQKAPKTQFSHHEKGVRRHNSPCLSHLPSNIISRCSLWQDMATHLDSPPRYQIHTREWGRSDHHIVHLLSLLVVEEGWARPWDRSQHTGHERWLEV